MTLRRVKIRALITYPFEEFSTLGVLGTTVFFDNFSGLWPSDFTFFLFRRAWCWLSWLICLCDFGSFLALLKIPKEPSKGIFKSVFQDNWLWV